MALEELNVIAAYNLAIKADGTSDDGSSTVMYPGYAVARSTNDKAVAADRAVQKVRADVLGLLGDYVGAASQTKIKIDPVGSTFVDPTTGAMSDFSNGMYVAPRLQAFQYNNAEQLNAPTNYTAGATGFQGPQRGVTYFISGSRVVVDKAVYANAAGASLKTNDVPGTPSWADAVFSGGDAWASGDKVTYGTGVNAGKLVKVVAASNLGAVVGVVEKFENSLLYLQIV